MSQDLKTQLMLRQRKKEAELESKSREKLELARVRFEEEQRRKQEEMRQRKVSCRFIRAAVTVSLSRLTEKWRENGGGGGSWRGNSWRLRSGLRPP